MSVTTTNETIEVIAKELTLKFMDSNSVNAEYVDTPEAVGKSFTTIFKAVADAFASATKGC